MVHGIGGILKTQLAHARYCHRFGTNCERGVRSCVGFTGSVAQIRSLLSKRCVVNASQCRCFLPSYPFTTSNREQPGADLYCRLTSVVTPKLVNRRSVTISPSCKRLRPDPSGAEHARRSGRYGEMFQRGRKVKEGRRWLMNLGVTTLGSVSPAPTRSAGLRFAVCFPNPTFTACLFPLSAMVPPAPLPAAST